jgi:hypothetical protein
MTQKIRLKFRFVSTTFGPTLSPTLRFEGFAFAVESSDHGLSSELS